MNAPLSARDVAVALGGRPVLRGIDLTVTDGEVVALLGSNGSGKSTLVRAAMGLVPLARGQVSVFGTALDRFSAWHRVGYVPQRPSAVGGVPATVWEVVAAGRLARRRLLRPLGRHDRTAIAAALEAVELGDRRHESAAQLSGGQQQRVLIARALAGEPDLLLLDEPTAGVDLHSQHAFADVLGRVTARGSTVLLVAHELGALEPLIHRTVVLHDGRIAYDGAPRPTAGLHAFHDHAHPERPPDPTILGGGWQP
ncbi:MAG: ATP-binding cassette domain-containing protein [Actinomycetota bacterium]|nr:ATP-binding cassette domain-containing protein [Actinomycetota bacterium]